MRGCLHVRLRHVCVSEVPPWSSFCESRPPWRVFCPFLLTLCQSTSVSISVTSFYLMHPLDILSLQLSILALLLPFFLLPSQNGRTHRGTLMCPRQFFCMRRQFQAGGEQGKIRDPSSWDHEYPEGSSRKTGP